MNVRLTPGVIGNGSWATALVKILTDNRQTVNWWVRNESSIAHITRRRHNPNYLPSVTFDTDLLRMRANVEEVVAASDLLVLAVPSAFVAEVLGSLHPGALKGKKVLSAIKGLVPGPNVLLNQYLHDRFGLPLQDYFAVLGPCHAEEVASEKLSYLTFSGTDAALCEQVAARFRTPYINTVTNTDILGVQYAAVLKNIYALGAGIAHGLEYGDNFLSVYIANSADEMAGFLRRAGIARIEVGHHEMSGGDTPRRAPNYAASVYLGDLLVTCYSPFSRNRTFGTMIGKGYTVQSAQLEMNMVAEGYGAARSIMELNKTVGAEMPIAHTIYQILWERLRPGEGFAQIEEVLV